MKLRMPLYPDPEKHQLRMIDADLPDDLTQEELWDFVLLLGFQLFGEEVGEKDGVSRCKGWNPAASLRQYELFKASRQGI